MTGYKETIISKALNFFFFSPFFFSFVVLGALIDQNVFLNVPPMAKGSPEYELYYSSKEVTKRKESEKKNKSKDNHKPTMSTKHDRNFVKAQITSVDESLVKFGTLESITVKQTR